MGNLSFIIGRRGVHNLSENIEFLKVLQHDLHKVRIPGALPHQVAMPNERAREADALAAWMGRNFLRESFEKSFYRKSLIFAVRNLQNPRPLIYQQKAEVIDLFKESNAVTLHAAILKSKLLNFFNEARYYPYSSLKYHILLTCALYYNFTKGHELRELYLCENVPEDSPLQIIYQDRGRRWSILPKRKKRGLSRIWPKFYHSWDYRKEMSLGGDFRVLAGLFSSIGSWSVALASIEDFHEFLVSN